MQLKDHYRILGVAPGASLKEIKTAFRKLAHQYHPDKSSERNFTTSHFRSIREAYSVLSDEQKRKRYDEERYFSGLSAAKNVESINSKRILLQVQKLSDHMKNVDRDRMNHLALYEYVSLLLSDAHIAVLQQESEVQINRDIIHEVLISVRNLNAGFHSSIAERLSILAATDNQLQQEIFLANHKRKQEQATEKYLPLIVIGITLLVCLLMFWYSR